MAVSPKFQNLTGRAIGIGAATTVVVAVTVYGFLTPVSLIDSSAPPSSEAVALAAPAAGPERIAVSGNLQSIGPKGLEGESGSPLSSEQPRKSVTASSNQNTTAPPVTTSNKGSVPSKDATPLRSSPPKRSTMSQNAISTQASTTRVSPTTPATAAPVTSPSRTAVLGFSVIDPQSGAQLFSLGRQTTISRRSPENNISIRAEASVGAESVVFYLDGSNLTTRSDSPFDIKGSDRWMERPGTYTLTANTYTGNGGKGASGTAYTSVITVV